MKKIFSMFSLLCAMVFVASCTNDIEVAEQGEGYLKLKVETIVSTYTRADVPTGYNAKKLYVAVLDANGQVAKSGDGVSLETNDWNNSETLKGNIKLAEGTYTIVAHSANWDGSNSAFDAPYYAGSTSVTIKRKEANTASVTCTLANVKVTVNFDDNFNKYFESAKAEVTSALAGVTARTFVMGQTTGSAYFPVADLNLKVTVNNDAAKSQTNEVKNVKARDHIIINYSVGDPVGSQGNITVVTDDATQTYTYTIQVPRKNLTSLQAKNASSWSTFAELSGKASLEKNDFENVTLQWRKKTDSEWTTVANNALTNNNGTISYKLKGLSASTAYTYRFVYNNGTDEPINSNEVNFTTEAQEQIYNSGFEDWYVDGKISVCGNSADPKYWNSSNAGAAKYIGSVTTQDTSFKRSGNSSAKLASAWAVVKLAAASLFTGDFIGLIGTKGAKLEWGVQFTSRPSALKGYYCYAPGPINRGDQPSGVGAPAEKSNDECQIFCALVTEKFKVANASNTDGYELTTSLNWATDPRVIAYGQMTRNTSSGGAWQEFNIPLVYYSTTKKPTHMIIVCSASKWGDYFYGSDSSVLNIDDFTFEYGEPTVR